MPDILRLSRKMGKLKPPTTEVTCHKRSVKDMEENSVLLTCYVGPGMGDSASTYKSPTHCKLGLL